MHLKELRFIILRRSQMPQHISNIGEKDVEILKFCCLYKCSFVAIQHDSSEAAGLTKINL